MHPRVADLEIVDAERTREILSSFDKRTCGMRIVRGRTAVHGKRKRNQRMPEEPAAYCCERHDPRPSSIALRDQVVTTMTEYAFDDFAPADAMKKRRVATLPNESVPLVGLVRHEPPDRYRPHCLGGAFERGLGVH